MNSIDPNLEDKLGRPNGGHNGQHG